MQPPPPSDGAICGKWCTKWGILILLLFAVHACSPVQRLTADTEGYNVSETDAAEIISRTPNHNKTITSLDGRARTQISRPGVSERATVTFVADRQQTLITIRNNLGIEGGRIHADRDSVTVYDRIEKTAWRSAADQTRHHFLIGFTAFNLIDFIDPILNADEVEMVLEDDRHYKLLFFDGKSVIFNRQNYLIERIVFNTADPESFSTFVFENYAGLSGYELPRTIRIFSQDGRSVIHLVTQALELNRNNLDFDIGIPSDLTISRI